MTTRTIGRVYDPHPLAGAGCGDARRKFLLMRARRCRSGQVLRCLAAVAFLAVASTGDALALWDDKLMLNASERLTYDDNVYRLSKDAPVPVSGSSRADWYSTTSLGFALDVPVSRQRFQAAYNLNLDRYQRNKDRNSDGYDARAIWLWQLGNSWSGQAGITETKALAGIGTVTGTGLDAGDSTAPNPVIVRNSFVNATYLLGANWRVQGGLNDQTITNGDPARKFQDVDIQTVDVSASYVSRAGNSLGIAVRQEQARYPIPIAFSGIAVDNDYDQTSLGLVLDWTPTGRSHIRARTDIVDRRYSQFPVRDFSGNTGRVSYDWQATGKLMLNATVFRDILTNVDINSSFSSFVIADGASLRPAWKFSEKTDVLGNVDYTKRKYRGDPGLAAAPRNDRIDDVWAVGLSIAHRPTRTVRLMLSVQHEERTSTILLQDYQVNIVFGSAQISF